MITDTTKILKVNADGIPEFLKAQPWWINWKPVFIDGKARKLPTCGETALRGQYWDTAGRPFADALRTVPEHGGVSLLLSLQNELACIDIDDCDANDPRLQKIKQLAPGAWYELSPSGHGAHVWGMLPDKRSYLLPGRKTIGYCGKEYEWYASGRGITVTGHPLCHDAQTNSGTAGYDESVNLQTICDCAQVASCAGAADTFAATRSVCCNAPVDLTPAVKFCESLRPKIAETKDTATPFSSALGADKTKHVAPAAFPAATSVDAILRKAFAKDSELQRMYYQGHSWDDKSREDFSFCRRLWFWLGGHGARAIETVFENSALYRKAKGPGYVSLTVRNAAKYWNGNYYGKGWTA